MKTPIYDFVKQYAASDFSRMHMPGHKGKTRLGIGVECFDITEIKGADSLFEADGIIAESERNAASLFNTAYTFYSTEGSTLSIKSMLTLALFNEKNEKKPKVLAGRNVHKAFIHAAALLDFDIEWLYGESSHLCKCVITAETLEKKLSELDSMPDAVYLTSPDYLGNIADVKSLSEVCHKYGIPLLVDNAHGAYLAFLDESMHPIALGADMCCDSAHKTLPVLTGGAYLHISKNCAEKYIHNVRERLSLFGSTSPSYLILSSLDLCNRYLSKGYNEKLSFTIERVDEAKKRLSSLGFTPEQTEPLKIVLNANKFGYTGFFLAEHLRTFKIEAEFSDKEYLVLMLTPQNTDEDVERLLAAFSSLHPKSPIFPETAEQNQICERVMSVRDAVLSPCEWVESSVSVGRIAASVTVSCPPAVPVVVSGERISEECAELLKYYGIEKIQVVK